MPLSNAQMRAIEIMIEQMERLQPRLERARKNRIANNFTGPTAEEVVRDFYKEDTRDGQFELNYLNAIGKCLAPDQNPEDMIVVTEL